MADMPDDEEPETFVQKAIKIGLITIPLMMYVSWAHKKFVPCPQVKFQQARPSAFKTSFAKGKRKNKKGKCHDSRSAKQEQKRGKCENSRSPEQNYQDQLSWISKTNEKDTNPSKDEYMDYLKRSAKGCCESVSKHLKGYNSNSKTDCEQLSDTHHYTSDPCSQQTREGKTEAQTEADTCSQSNTQSETISPEAFDKLFEQHFQKCVDDLKQHTKKLGKEVESLKQDCEKNEKPEANKNGNYLECLADLNLDKDFECDPNFHTKDADTPYVVKDYKCKDRKGGKPHQNETSGISYLECLTNLNMDKHFEEKQGTQSYCEGKTVNSECCPGSKVKGYADIVKSADECETDSYNRTKKDDKCRTTKKDPCAWKTQEEELCKNETASDENTPKGTVEEYNIYTNAKLDDCGCDPHFNTKDSDKYGTMKGEPCAYRSVKEQDTDDDALKDFWHACGPPKGLRTGCRPNGCNNPCEKQK